MAKKPAKKSPKPQSTLTTPRKAAQASETATAAVTEAAELAQEHLGEPLQEHADEPAAEAIPEPVAESVVETVPEPAAEAAKPAPAAPKPKKARYVRPTRGESAAAAPLPTRSTTPGGKMMSKDVKAGPKAAPPGRQKPADPHARP